MKKLFTICIVFLCFYTVNAAEGDTLYYEGFEVADVNATVFYYNPEWIAWNEAYVVDTVKYRGAKSLLVPAGKGTWGEFVGKVASWSFKPNKFYKVKMTVKLAGPRSIDITRLPEGSVLYHNQFEMDAFDNNGEWVVNLNTAENVLAWTGNWQQVVMYIKYGTGTPNDNGPSLGLGWGGDSNLFIDDISVVESSEDEMIKETAWLTEVTPTGKKDLQLKQASTLYPNPAKDMVSIATDFDITNVKIYSLTGALVKSINMNTERSFSTYGIKSGVYTVVIEGKNELSKTRLVVK
jgi:hypothetical protein